MSLTLKQTLDMVVSSTGALPSNSWANSTNSSDRQMVALANLSVMYLRDRRFQAQIKQTQFTTSADSTRYAPPTSMLGIVPDTMWVQSSMWKVDFPTDPTVWAYLLARGGPSGVQVKARMIDNAIEIYEPQGGITIGYEYYTKACVFDERIFKELFESDTDQHLFDDALLIADIKWRYKKEKGIDDWQIDRQLARDQLIDVLGSDAGAKTIEPCQPWDPSPKFNAWVYPT